MNNVATPAIAAVIAKIVDSLTFISRMDETKQDVNTNKSNGSK